MTTEERIYGCLSGAAVAEAKGAVTSMWTPDLIKKEYGEYVDTLRKPPVSTPSKGMAKAGQVTGNFSFAWMMLRRIIQNGGTVEAMDAQEVVVEWAKNPEYYRYANISSIDAYHKYGDTEGGYRYPYLTFDHHKATNESAARAVGVAVFFPYSVEMAIEYTILAYKNVFDNTIGLSGAGAVAAAISKGLQEGSNYYDVLQAAIYGARRGLDVAESYRVQPAACASVQRRCELAVEIGLRYGNDFEKAMRELEECVGNGLFANESVATAIGCVAACKGKKDAVKMAVNIGNETDSMANIAGAIAGALHPESVDPKEIAVVEEVNGFDFASTSKTIDLLNQKNRHYYI